MLYPTSRTSYQRTPRRPARALLGLTLGAPAIFKSTPEGQRREAESDADYAKRVAQGTVTTETASNGENECQVPELTAPDPHHYTVTSTTVLINGGIDLDGQISRTKGHAAPNTCPHDDFTTFDGRQGVDNQFQGRRLHAVISTHGFVRPVGHLRC